MKQPEMTTAAMQAHEIGRQFEAARLFADKHDDALAWDVKYHEAAARQTFESLADLLGYRVERIELVQRASL
jgi:hypothetical protein